MLAFAYMNWTAFTLPITDPIWIFLIVLMIILFAPILFNQLRIPNIIGMILAGVLIGEHGLDLLTRDSSFELFGNVGLYYIMFLAGLEINMNDFKKHRNKAAMLGVLAFIIPMLAGILVNTSFLKYGLTTSILLASMYASHTLVAYPIVLRLGISRQRSVSIAVGATAATDTLTLLVLAIISNMYNGNTGELFWLGVALKIVVVGAIILYTFPRLAKWFFRKYNDTALQFIFVLVLVFMAGGLMSLAGLEGILGAFLAGMLLNRLIPGISPLKNHLEFIGNNLFIPYFLIGVGMMLDLSIIFGHGQTIKVALVMTITALGGKWIACWLTQKIYKMSGLERRLIYGLSTAQAAATLAAVLVGYNIILPDGARLLNEDVLNGTILLILITCIVSSVVTEQAARKAAIEEPQPEQPKDKRAEKILIPIANPDTVQDLVCLSLAVRNPKIKDNLFALSIINDTGDGQTARTKSGRNLDHAAKIAASAGAEIKKLIRYDINIASGIIHTVKEQDITSVIIGIRREADIKSPIFGDLAINLLKDLHCEIMISRLMVPINTLKNIIVVIPPKAEFEPGFQKWIEHFCRMSVSLGRKLKFHGHPDSLVALRKIITKRYKSVNFSSSTMYDFAAQIPAMAAKIKEDSLLAIISSRHGSISHGSFHERLPKLLSKEFSHTSLMLLYPENYDNTIHSLNLY